jgi:drug/metabolite transporter (DMT)-like permease
MKRSDFASLLLLAALWGSSYLFMRLSAGAFGPVALASVRAGIAALVLLPIVVWRGGLTDWRVHWPQLLVVGLTQSALPFVLFSFAATRIPSGLSAILGATTPLFTALIARFWLGDRLDASRVTGLAVGFSGVLWLVGGKAGLTAGGGSACWAVVACLLAALLYGFSSNYTKRTLASASPLAVAAGTQLASTLMLALPAVGAWPEIAPTPRAWAALIVLAIACSAVAYVLFYRLIARVGAARTVSVTYLIPAFGVLWGRLFLGEAITPRLALGCAVILAGTALTTGVIRLPRLAKLTPTPSAP